MRWWYLRRNSLWLWLQPCVMNNGINWMSHDRHISHFFSGLSHVSARRRLMKRNYRVSFILLSAKWISLLKLIRHLRSWQLTMLLRNILRYLLRVMDFPTEQGRSTLVTRTLMHWLFLIVRENWIPWISCPLRWVSTDILVINKFHVDLINCSRSSATIWSVLLPPLTIKLSLLIYASYKL